MLPVAGPPAPTNNQNGAAVMGVSLGKWGFAGSKVGGFVCDLHLGDVYIKVPGLGELAWNTVGLVSNRA